MGYVTNELSQRISEEPQYALDLDEMFERIDKVRKARDDAKDSEREFNRQIADLDLQAQKAGIGTVQGNYKTGSVGVVPYAGGPRPSVDDLIKQRMLELLDQQMQGQGGQGSPGVPGSSTPSQSTGNAPPQGFPPMISGFNAGGMTVQTDTPRQQAERALKLQEQFTQSQVYKDYQEIAPRVKQLEALDKRIQEGDIRSQTAFDVAMVTIFNKVLDPGSVVRESEYARVPENLPVVNRMIVALKKFSTGQAMTPSDRKSLIEAAKVIADEMGTAFNNQIDQVSKIAGKFAVNPELVLSGPGMERHTPYNKKKNDDEVEIVATEVTDE